MCNTFHCMCSCYLLCLRLYCHLLTAIHLYSGLATCIPSAETGCEHTKTKHLLYTTNNSD